METNRSSLVWRIVIIVIALLLIAAVVWIFFFRSVPTKPAVQRGNASTSSTAQSPTTASPSTKPSAGTPSPSSGTQQAPGAPNPSKPTGQNRLADTGPGSTILLFVVTAAITGLSHYFVNKRKALLFNKN